jgi:hypothetical protein
MPDTKITALTALTTADPANDMMPIVDVSDTTMAASGTTKRISINNILACSPSATLASATITGNLTVDTNTLFVDSANDRVTVGTLSAYGKLTVGVGSGSQTTTITNVAAGLIDIDFTSSGTINTRFSFVNASGVTNAAIDRIGNPSLSDSGNLAFLTRAGSGSLTERYRIAADGVATWSEVGGVAGTAMTLNSTGLGVGVTPSAGRGAIQLSAGVGFPATQVASSDANTLDDYVETTFSPTIIGSTTAGSATYSTQVGRATKVGRLVTFQLRVAYSAGTGTGNLRVGGLPFTAGVGSVFTIYAENIALTASNYAVSSLSSGNTFISVDQLPVGGGAATAVAYDAAGDIQISGSYIV